MFAEKFIKALKHHFIPHAGNNYHPHIFHTKRAVGYSAFFVAMKAFVIAYAVMLPIQAYTAPEVLSAQANKILALTNRLRSDHGLAELTRAYLLDGSAGSRALDMARYGYFSHTGPDDHTFAYFMKQTGNRYVDAGENLAEGFTNADDVVNAWTASPSHYVNLIDTNFKEFGIGISEGSYEGRPTIFIAEHFGKPTAVHAEVDARSGGAIASPSAPVVTKPLENTPPAGSLVGVVLSEPPETASMPLSTSTAPSSEAALTGTDPEGEVLSVSSNGEQDTNDAAGSGALQSSAWGRYEFAKSWFSGVLSVFSVSNWVYKAFLLFFISALGLSLAVEFRRHHPHAVMKAAGLIGLLFVLWVF